MISVFVSGLLATAASAAPAPVFPAPAAVPAQAAPQPQPVPHVRTAPPPVAVDPRVAALRDRAMHDELAFRIVEGLTTEIGPRPDGSEAETRARAWAVARLKSLGFSNVRIEPYQLHNVWQRGVETAEVVAPFPQPLRLTALGGDAGRGADTADRLLRNDQRPDAGTGG
jgi:hypothetical protein